MGHRVTILLPKVSQNYTDEVVERITKRFKGCTTSNAYGVWVNEFGTEEFDSHTRVEVSIGCWEQERDWFMGLCQVTAEILDQDSIYLSVTAERALLIGRERGDVTEL